MQKKKSDFITNGTILSKKHITKTKPKQQKRQRGIDIYGDLNGAQAAKQNMMRQWNRIGMDIINIKK